MSELNKKIRDGGGKAWQRDDKEDRTIVYKDWINNFDTNGFWLDADAIKWRKSNGKYVPFAITELTACEWETTAKDKYLESLEDRFFRRDKQGEVIEELGRLLNVPVYIVVFPPSMSWVYVYSFRKKKWQLFDPSVDWITYLRTL